MIEQSFSEKDRDGSPDIKETSENEHVEDSSTPQAHNLIYEGDEEPELHLQTYFALAAMFFLNLVQVFALMGPPAGLSYIEADLKNSVAGTWVPNALSLVQAVLCPLISSASDTFQARKILLVGPSVISFIGAAIAPGATDIYRVIAAQVLIGFGFATVPLAYSVPSEILPRKWRPMVQSSMNVAAALGACSAPLIIGSLTRNNAHTGWRNFYWIQMALWGLSAIGLFIGYRPPKRHTGYDHLTLWQKIGRLDLPGFFLLTAGLTIFLAGLNLGGGMFPWTAAPVLATLIVGILCLISFGIYEWKFTKNGILSHELFRNGEFGGRTFALCVALIFIEGILLFSYTIFYPTLTESLFETDPFLLAARGQPFWIAGGIGTVIYGFISTKFKTIRVPLSAGFLLLTAGVVGLATIQPGDDTRALVFAGLAGLGFGSPLILLITAVQLCTPHHLIATATAVTTCSRAIAVAVFTAIFTAAMKNRLTTDIPSYVGKAAIEAGLPQNSIGAFIADLSAGNTAALADISGVNSTIIAAGSHALQHAYADGIRVVYIIAAPFGFVACIAAWFMGDLAKVMDYTVHAPVEDLHARRKQADSSA